MDRAATLRLVARLNGPAGQDPCSPVPTAQPGTVLAAVEPCDPIRVEFIERLVLEQRGGQPIQARTILAQLLERAGVALVDDASGL